MFCTDKNIAKSPSSFRNIRTRWFYGYKYIILIFVQRFSIVLTFLEIFFNVILLGRLPMCFSRARRLGQTPVVAIPIRCDWRLRKTAAVYNIGVFITMYLYRYRRIIPINSLRFISILRVFASRNVCRPPFWLIFSRRCWTRTRQKCLKKINGYDNDNIGV